MIYSDFITKIYVDYEWLPFKIIEINMSENISYSVEESITILMSSLSESTGSKYLKSKRCLKNTLGQLVFEILLFSSKWNESGKRVEVNAEFRVSYKKFGPVSTVYSIIAGKRFRPDSGSWYNISTETSLKKTYNLLDQEIQATVVNLYKRFEEDTDKACRFLLVDVFYEYSVALDYLAEL